MVDSLKVDQLTQRDKEFLDSCLLTYHNTTQDTNKIKILDSVCSRLYLKNEDWIQFQLLQLETVESKLKKTLTKKVHSFLKKAHGRALNGVAVGYSEKGNVPETMKYYFKAIQAFEDIGDSIAIAMLNNNIGTLCREMGNYQLALKHFRKSLRLSLRLDHDYGKLVALSAIGDVYTGQGKYQRGLELMNICLALYRKHGKKKREAITLTRIGGVLFLQGNLNQALDSLNKSLKICNDIHLMTNIADIQFCKAKIFNQQGKLDSTLKTARIGLEIAQNVGHVRRIENLTKILYPIYEKQGNIGQAYETFKLYSRAKRTTFNKKNETLINRLETKLELDKKNNRILLLDKENRLKAQQLRIIILTTACFLITLIMSGFIFLNYRRRKYEQELQTLRKLKSESNANIVKKKLVTIPVTVGKKMITIDFDKITFFKAQSNFVFLNTNYGRSYIVDYTLSALEKNLPVTFYRIHRSFIINKSHVKEIKKTTRRRVVLTMSDKSSSNIPSGMVYSEQVQTLIKGLGH